MVLEGGIYYAFQSCEKEAIFAGTVIVPHNFSICLRKQCSAENTEAKQLWEPTTNACM